MKKYAEAFNRATGIAVGLNAQQMPKGGARGRTPQEIVQTKGG